MKQAVDWKGKNNNRGPIGHCYFHLGLWTTELESKYSYFLKKLIDLRVYCQGREDTISRA